MTTQLPIAAVVGASGTQGGSVAKALSEAGYIVRGLTRDPSSLPAHPNIIPTFFDINDISSVRAAFENAEVVFACMTNPDVGEILALEGTYKKEEGSLNEVELGKRLVDVAKEKGVRIFVWSSSNRKVAENDGYSGTPLGRKLEVNDYLEKAGLPFVALALGWFNENFTLKFSRVAIEESTGDVIYTIPHGKLEGAVYDLASITHDLGRVVTLIAKNFESSNLDGITVTVAERVYSNQDILNVLQKVTGRKARLESPDFFIEKGRLLDKIYRLRAEGPYATPELVPDAFLTKLGFKFQPLEEYAKEVIVPFLGL